MLGSGASPGFGGLPAGNIFVRTLIASAAIPSAGGLTSSQSCVMSPTSGMPNIFVVYGHRGSRKGSPRRMLPANTPRSTLAVLAFAIDGSLETTAVGVFVFTAAAAGIDFRVQA